MNTRTSELSDSGLLREYVAHGDEDAFAELVRRHLPMVYSAAARRLNLDPLAAEDVSQTVFVQLAKEGGRLSHHPVLAGWLYLTATRMAADHSRRQVRRQRRENLTMNLEDPEPAASNPAWPELKPVLDEAMRELPDDDRHAVILRYFEGRKFSAVGGELGLTADAARMRVARGLERLRTYLKERGIASSVVALEAILSQESVQAVPVGLAHSIARSIRGLPTAGLAAPVLAGGTKLLAVAVVLLFAASAGWVAFRPRQPVNSSDLSSSADRSRLAPASGDSVRLLLGRVRVRPAGARVDPKVVEALGYLRSALFDTQLDKLERARLLNQSAGMLVGAEGESISLFREALTAADADVVSMAIEGIGRFGALPREFGVELLSLLENPDFKDQAGLIANRLVPSIVVDEAPLPGLLSRLGRRPDVGSQFHYLITAAIGADSPRLTANREAVEALLDNPNLEIRAVAKAILEEVPPAPPLPTTEVSNRLIATLQSAEETERHRALTLANKLQRATPEIRQALGEAMRHDPSPQLRIDARLELTRLAPDDPALAVQPIAETDHQNLIARLGRDEVSVSEMVDAIADRSGDTVQVIQGLSSIADTYWSAHADEKMLVYTVLAALHRDQDAKVYEAVSEVYSRLNHIPRPFYTIDQLAPYFAAMETTLTPGEYAITMRDLKSSLESYWKARGFTQPEPTHLPADLVKTLLVGPAHQNRPAYEQMLRAIREVDPAFQEP